MPRVTINDIARQAGVSKGAVSYALNGRPGVSAATRERIVQVASELGWAPSRTARPGTRSEAFGLILTGEAQTLAVDPFPMRFLAGLHSVLSVQSYALLLQVTPTTAAELETYRRWTTERRVDAVAVLEVRPDDPRVSLLRALDLPAVFVGHPALARRCATVVSDDAEASELGAHVGRRLFALRDGASAAAG